MSRFLLAHITLDEYRERCEHFDRVARAAKLAPFDRHEAWRRFTSDEHCHEWPVPSSWFWTDPYYVGPEVSVRPMIRDFLTDFFDPQTLYELFIFVAGLGSGKSFSASLAILRQIYELSCLRRPQRYMTEHHAGVSLSGDAPIVLMNASAAGAKQAGKIVYGETFEKIMAAPYFKIDFPPLPGRSTELEFEHRISLTPGTSKWESALGYNMFFFVVDEAAFGIESERADYVRELFLAFNQRRKSRFGYLGGGGVFTSPGSEYGFVEAIAHEGQDWDRSIMVRRTTTWEAKDELKPGVHIFLLDRDPDVVRILEEDLIFQGWAEGGTVGIASRPNGEVIRWRVTPAQEGEIHFARAA